MAAIQQQGFCHRWGLTRRSTLHHSSLAGRAGSGVKLPSRKAYLVASQAQREASAVAITVTSFSNGGYCKTEPGHHLAVSLSNAAQEDTY